MSNYFSTDFNSSSSSRLKIKFSDKNGFVVRIQEPLSTTVSMSSFPRINKNYELLGEKKNPSQKRRMMSKHDELLTKAVNQSILTNIGLCSLPAANTLSQEKSLTTRTIRKMKKLSEINNMKTIEPSYNPLLVGLEADKYLVEEKKKIIEKNFKAINLTTSNFNRVGKSTIDTDDIKINSIIFEDEHNMSLSQEAFHDTEKLVRRLDYFDDNLKNINTAKLPSSILVTGNNTNNLVPESRKRAFSLETLNVKEKYKKLEQGLKGKKLLGFDDKEEASMFINSIGASRRKFNVVMSEFPNPLIYLSLNLLASFGIILKSSSTLDEIHMLGYYKSVIEKKSKLENMYRKE